MWGLVRYLWCWVFFCNQKTAYEMRISDWSSDVCSSDLVDQHVVRGEAPGVAQRQRVRAEVGVAQHGALGAPGGAAGVEDRSQVVAVARHDAGLQIGRASCRDRVCQYV